MLQITKTSCIKHTNTNKKNKLAMTLTLAASCLGLIASQPAAQAYGYSTPNIMGGYDYHGF